MIRTEPPGCATMDVGDWLRSLGLGQYEAAFRENEIDGKVLPKLTVDDLTDLGVVLIGHRRTILSATGLLYAPLTPAAPIAEGVSASPAAHGDVLRSRRLDGACRTARP